MLTLLVLALLLAINLPLARLSFTGLERLKTVSRGKRFGAGFGSTLVGALSARLYIEQLPPPAGAEDWGHYFSACYGLVPVAVLLVGFGAWFYSRRHNSLAAALLACVALLFIAFLPAPYMSLYAQ